MNRADPQLTPRASAAGQAVVLLCAWVLGIVAVSLVAKDRFQAKTEPGDPERHPGLPAWKRDESSPVWDMSQERVFIETLLNQRFNFFLIFFSLVVGGALNTKVQLHFQLVLTLGTLVCLLFAAVLERSQEKFDLIFKDLHTDLTHPLTIIDRRARSGGSRRKWIGRFIPAVCCVGLITASCAAWLGWLPVPSAVQQPDAPDERAPRTTTPARR